MEKMEFESMVEREESKLKAQQDSLALEQARRQASGLWLHSRRLLLCALILNDPGSGRNRQRSRCSFV